MNDEKTTEIEIPHFTPNRDNIVRVNFHQRRKTDAPKVPFQPSPDASVFFAPAKKIPAQTSEWTTPWWVRLAALAGILILSLFVL
jgi:hypothetical protein